MKSAENALTGASYLTDDSGSEAAAQVVRIDAERGAIRLSGAWTLAHPLPSVADTLREMRQTGDVRQIQLDAEAVGAWDSGLLSFAYALAKACRDEGIELEFSGLPAGPKALMELATAVPERGGPRPAEDSSVLHRIGRQAHSVVDGFNTMLEFVGQFVLGLGRFCTGRAKFRSSDFWALVNDCGVQALPIVSLVSVLIGLILAFVGAVQLQQFGAQIFVANLVGVSMAREMGAMMTAIIMAGRTGAAFAAQIGTMQVNEEVDALRTLGISETDFLVTPRAIALLVMMPLLCLYAITLGIMGGMVVGVAMLDINPTQYLIQTGNALKIGDFVLGITKSAVFGAIIAVTGCFYGIRCGRSASSVGTAATSAVVTSMVIIVVADGLFAVVTNVLGI